ncbi:hypothetical protein A5789_23530 [Nocardia sp. 852002-51101_SCH5132738]|nr:hypothetical protein A5789_23530 [Nocardia sp. 852002-51101_SCH5132738]OBB34808.1 hypothetical protein A5748_06280 [Nocardia sp. 852002-51244_SCH5132740]OBF80986.1 hypothetical protein A9X06_20395 [Mycobacterium sp. 852002-51759_SCH5129042]
MLALSISIVIGIAAGPVWAAPPEPSPSSPVTTSPSVPVPSPPAASVMPGPTSPHTSPPPSTAPVPAGMCTDPDGCVPQQPPDSRRGEQRPAAPEPDCGIDHISGCVVEAMDGFFRNLVSSALNPLLELLSTTLLATPAPASLPRVGQLWSSSWQITLTVYGLLIMAAGVLVMSYQTLQSRWSAREIAPGLILGMIAAALSFPLLTLAVRAANAFSAAVAGDGVDPDSAGQALRQLVTSPEMVGTLGIFGLLLGLVLVVGLVALLLGYVIRVVVTIVLVVAAPLALMCHALPITEPIARWWWRSVAACLAIQVIQSLALITATRVFLSPDGWKLNGGSNGGLINLIVSIALVGILAKVPFWMLSAMRIGSGRSLVGGMVRSYLAYKTFGMLRGASKPSTPPRPAARTKAAGKLADPYSKVQTAADGQMLLPLPGIKRSTPKPKPATPAAGRDVPAPPSPDMGRQLKLDLTTSSLPLPREAPRPDGQYALFYASPVTKPPGGRRPPGLSATRGGTTPTGTAGTAASTPTGSKRTPKGRQLALRFPAAQPAASSAARPADPYARPKATAHGQYVLPLDVTRVRRPTPPPASAWIAPPAPRPAGRQLHLPLPDLPVRRRRRPDTGGTR